MSRKVEIPKIDRIDLEKINIYLQGKYFSFTDVRNQAIIALLLTTGIKTEVLLALNIQDYNKEKGTLIPTHKKAPRELKLDDQTQEILNSYISVRMKKLSNGLYTYSEKKVSALFIGKKNITSMSYQRISSRQLQRIVKNLAQLYKFSTNITPKSFRHIAGLYYVRHGYDSKAIDKILGSVAPWVKTDYRKISEARIATPKVLISPKQKLIKAKCKNHNLLMEEAKHRKYGAIWLCPIRGCTYILDHFGLEIEN